MPIQPVHGEKFSAGRLAGSAKSHAPGKRYATTIQTTSAAATPSGHSG